MLDICLQAQGDLIEGCCSPDMSMLGTRLGSSRLKVDVPSFGEATLPARTGTSQWPDEQGEHQEEQKPRAEALQDQDSVSPVEAGLKY